MILETKQLKFRISKLNFFSLGVFAFVFLVFALSVNAQKIAVLSPDETDRSRNFGEKLATSLSENFKILDDSLSEAAFSAIETGNPFNQTTAEAKNIGARIGCNYFILVKNETLRRSSFQKNEYYESYAVIYVVSSRTGKLVFSKLNSVEEDLPSRAETKLSESVGELAKEISREIKAAEIKETNETTNAKINDLPDENSKEAEGFRPPLPYRRIKPEYTRLADFYNIAATVDILVDVGADGGILRTEIVRWAGFGLDESVEKTVRQMNWRAADHNGKSMAMRVLLRYNFKDIKTDE